MSEEAVDGRGRGDVRRGGGDVWRGGGEGERMDDVKDEARIGEEGDEAEAGKGAEDFWAGGGEPAAE